MERAYDARTGRPLIDGRDNPPRLTEDELQAELTIVSARPHQHANRLEARLLELARCRAVSRNSALA